MLMKRFGKPSTWTAASRVTGAAFMLLGPGGLAGCKQGGVVDNQYEGQELARINGQITSTVLPDQDSISIGIVWVTSRDPYKEGGPGGQGGAGGFGGQGGFGGFGGFGGDAGAGGFGGEAGAGGFGGEAGAGGFGGFGGVGGDAGGGGFGGFGGAGGSFGAGGAGGGSEPTSGPTAPGDGRPTAPMASFTLRGRKDPGPTGSLLEPAPIGCDGLPIQVKADLSHVAGGTAIARTVTFQPSFPQGFTIPLTALPPAEAMVPLEVAVKGSGQFAEARIVAFVDQNHNDKLDLPSPDSAPDLILAVSEQRIFYLDGVFPPIDVAVTGYNPTMTLPIGVGHLLPQGFSLLDLGGNVVPASSPIDLPLATTQEEKDRAALRVCASYEEWIEHDGTTPAAPEGAFIVNRDRFVNGHYQIGWNYYPPSGNPCYQVAILGDICE